MKTVNWLVQAAALVAIIAGTSAVAQVRLPDERLVPPSAGDWDWGWLAPGLTYRIELTVVNRCKTTETIYLTYWTRPSSLDPHLPESVTLKAGDSRIITAEVNVPPDATGDIAGEFFIHYYGNPSPPCLGRTDGFAITGRILTPERATQDVDGTIAMLRQEIAAAQVELQAIKDSLFQGAFEASFVLDEIEELEKQISYLITIAAQIEEKQLTTTLNGIRTSVASTRTILQSASTREPTPESGSWYTDADRGLRRGRQLMDDAADLRAEGQIERARELAQTALDQQQDARRDLDAGVNTGTIGSNTAASMKQVIDDTERRALELLEGTKTREIAVAPSLGPSIGLGKTFTRFDPPVAFPPVDDDPRDEPPPVIFGEEVEASVTDGAFQPTQAVWQDDEYFKDTPGKQLTKLGTARWKAELAMVKSRPTLVFGTRPLRDYIIFKGITTGTVSVPLKLRVTLRQGGGERIVYEEDQASHRVPLEGKAGAPAEWMVSVEAPKGLPDEKKWGPFTFINAGPYQLVAELVRGDGSATGLRITVDGNVIDVSPMRVKFVPVSLRQLPASEVAALEQSALHLGEKSARWIPRAFPLPRDGLIPSTAPMQVVPALPDSPLQRLVDTFFSTSLAVRYRDATAAAVYGRFAAQALLTDADRMVILMDRQTFGDLWDEHAEGVAGTDRVVTIRAPGSPATVAHEIAHTMPPPLWSDKQMVQLFGFTYHNREDKGVGTGVDIGTPRDVRRSQHAIMGPAYHEAVKWISQGTYWNLLQQLGQPSGSSTLTTSSAPAQSTPPAEHMLVRGYALREQTRVAGLIGPVYNMPPGARGRAVDTGWALVQRSASGAELARDTVPIVWTPADDPRERDIVSFATVIARVTAARRLELIGPANTVVTQRAISAAAPTVRITAPAGSATQPVNGSVRVEWTAADADRDALVYTVLYSADGGVTWDTIAFEQQERTATVRVAGRPADARIRVIASDGGRSTTAEIPLRVQ